MPNFSPLRGDSIYMPSYIYGESLLKKSPLRGDFRSIYMNFVAYTLKISPLRGDIIYMPSYIYAEFIIQNRPFGAKLYICQIIYMPSHPCSYVGDRLETDSLSFRCFSEFPLEHKHGGQPFAYRCFDASMFWLF